MPSPAAVARIAEPVSAGRCSNVRQEPRDMADTSMPDEPSGRGRRTFAGIGQPPFNVPTRGSGAALSDGVPGWANTPRSRPVLAVHILFGELWWCGGQPAVCDHLAQRLCRRLPQLDEHGRVAVEMRDREKGVRVR